MADGAYLRDVAELRDSLGRAVATLLGEGGFARPTGGDRGGRPAGRGGTRTEAGAGGRPHIEGSSSSSREAALRDERSMRALAKEIKRLITEDARRGIGI